MSKRNVIKVMQALIALAWGGMFVFLGSSFLTYLKVRVDAFDCGLTSECIIVPIIFGLGCSCSAVVGQAFRLPLLWNAIGSPVVMIAGLKIAMKYGIFGTAWDVFNEFVAIPIHVDPLVIVGVLGGIAAILSAVGAHLSWKHTPRVYPALASVLLTYFLAGFVLMNLTYYQMRQEGRMSSQWAQRVLDAAREQKHSPEESGKHHTPKDKSTELPPVPGP